MLSNDKWPKIKDSETKENAINGYNYYISLSVPWQTTLKFYGDYLKKKADAK